MVEEMYLHVTSGRGPKECNLAVRLVVDRMSSEADKNGVILTEMKAELLEGLPCSIIVRLTGCDVGLFVKRWRGTICWVCKSPFRPLHKRKNWFVEVKSCYPPTKEKALDLKDVHFQSMRSSGAGGQHVNKVSSAIRATHHPSGVSVQVMDTRSQLQNKEIAIERLAERLEELARAKLHVAKEQQWRNQLEVKRGLAKRVFHGQKFIEQ